VNAVAKMVDAYQKRTGTVSAVEERVSSLEIDLCPVLQGTPDLMRWMQRFRDAPTNHEKRQVLMRFRQWKAEHYPHDEGGTPDDDHGTEPANGH
jgi:hypothetical protein